MTLYDWLAFPPNSYLDQSIDKLNFLHMADLCEERQQILNQSISQIILKCVVPACSQTVSGGEALYVLEIEVMDYQYMYFVPSAIKSNLNANALMIFKLGQFYKLCVECPHEEATARFIFTGWIEPSKANGRICHLLKELNYANVEIQAKASGAFSYYQQSILMHEAVYLAYPKIENMGLYLLTRFEYRERSRYKKIVLTNAIPYKYFKENRGLKEKREAGKEEDRRPYHEFNYLYDADQIWDNVIRSDWLRTKILERKIADIIDWLNSYENYYSRHRDLLSPFTRGDKVKGKRSLELSRSDWYQIDFTERIKRGQGRYRPERIHPQTEAKEENAE